MKKRSFGSSLIGHRAARWREAELPSALVVPDTSALPQHDPPLEARDEAVFLLTAVAEIEHALMVQYLFAAFSLNVTAYPEVAALQERLLAIAREEMAHLLTVQNLLHLLGGPLNFDREQAPETSEIYPFRFQLEPVTLDSLAKYVLAESPRTWSGDEQQEIERRATRSNEGVPVQHVGPIFASLKRLLQDKLADTDFQLDTVGLQGQAEDWTRGFDRLLVHTFGGADVALVRQAASAAVDAIAQQGEGDEDRDDSHFNRFLASYREFKALSVGGTVQLTWPIAKNPNTTVARTQPLTERMVVEFITEAQASEGRITHPRTKNWAYLCNFRYRMLLASLSHYLRIDKMLTGEYRAFRDLLRNRTFSEIGRIRTIAEMLMQLPKDDAPGTLNAGPPFELPYTMNLPERGSACWRSHLSVSRAATRLIERMIQDGETASFLTDLLRSDQAEQVILASLAAGRGIPSPLTGSLSFASDIKEMFRASPDRASMLPWFDLYKYEDVRDHADRILTRLAAGEMPCDGGWPADRVEKFRQWIAGGKQP